MENQINATTEVVKLWLDNDEVTMELQRELLKKLLKRRRQMENWEGMSREEKQEIYDFAKRYVILCFLK